MPRTRQVETEEVTPEVEEVTNEEVTPEVEEVASGDSVTVFWREGSRVYSKADHGKEYKLLANEFAAKKEGKVV